MIHVLYVRMAGIEPTPEASKAATLPLRYILFMRLALAPPRADLAASSSRYRECVLLGRLGSNQRHVGSPVNSRAHYHSATTEQNTL